MTTITSRQHPLVQTFRAVARGGRGLALVDGWHLLEDAARAGARVDLVALHGAPPDAACGALVDQLAADGVRVVQVSAAVLNALSPVRTPTGVVALVERPAPAPEAVLRPDPALVLLAVGMQDPGNVGATLRAAEAGGATGVLFAGTTADPFGWKALRAAMGSTFRLPVTVVPDPLDACAWLRRQGLRVLATTPRGGVAMHEADLAGPVAIVLGGEGPGLPPALAEAADGGISIPMARPVESLNVAVAAALLVYEARRQRGAPLPHGPSTAPGTATP